MDKNFAQIAKEVLDAYDWNENQLAERLGTTQPTVNRIKTGKSKSPRYDLAVRLIALYDARPRARAA
jgi:transcriptional regulator with XRE-family HTH domain